jgi:hypothetical protein
MKTYELKLFSKIGTTRFNKSNITSRRNDDYGKLYEVVVSRNPKHATITELEINGKNEVKRVNLLGVFTNGKGYEKSGEYGIV